MAGLRGKYKKQSPDRAGPKGCPSRKLSSSFSSTEDHAGGQAGGQHPRRRFPERNPFADRDDAKTNDAAWRRRRARAPHHPFRLRDIAEADPHGPDVLLLIPLKLRDVEDAFSSHRPPLANILLASRPKETKPPSPGVGRGKRTETLRARGKLEARAGRAEEERESPGPLFVAALGAKPYLLRGQGLDRP